MFIPILMYLFEHGDADIRVWLDRGEPTRQTIQLRELPEGLQQTYLSNGNQGVRTLSDRDALADLEGQPDCILVGRMLWKISRVIDGDFSLDQDLRSFVESATGIHLERTPFYLKERFAVNSMDGSLYKQTHKPVDYIKVKIENNVVAVAVDLSCADTQQLLLKRLRRMLWQS